jgi:hypothetical protein
MPTRTTDFYLNLDRWEALSVAERTRGHWEERLRGPEVRVAPPRQEAAVEAAWAMHLSDSPLNRELHKVLMGANPPDATALPGVQRAWGYCRAVQFAHGWYPAFRWNEGDIGQLCRVLGEPSQDAIERAAHGILSLHGLAGELGRQCGGVPLVEIAAYYGGLRCLSDQHGTFFDPYFLGLRILFIQRGYVQVLFAPIESVWRSLNHERPTTAQKINGVRDLEEQLGTWLDEVSKLLVTAGNQAEEIWRRTAEASSRTSLQESILTLAHRNGRVTAGDVLRETGANRNTVKDNLARLVRSGALRRQGSKRGTVYLPV